MTDIKLQIKTLAQQWQVQAHNTKSESERRDFERQIFGLEMLCVRMGWDTLEVDLEFSRSAINGTPPGAA